MGQQEQERQGQAISIDFASAMAIFVFMLAVGLFLFQDALLPQGGFSEQVEAAGATALDTFVDRTEWTVQRERIIVHSSHPLENEPLTVDTPFPPDIVRESVVVTEDGREIVSEHNFSTNETVFVADVKNGTTLFSLVYTKDLLVADRNYSTTLDTHQSSAWNADLNTTFDSRGFTRLFYKDLAMLDTRADLGGGSAPSVRDGVVRANVTYDDAVRKTLFLYEDAGTIEITETFNGEERWRFNLTGNFTRLYGAAADSVYDLDRSGVIYDNTTDFVDFSAVRGLAFIGKDMEVRVERDSPTAKIEARINFTDDGGEKELLLYAHDGNHTNATNRYREFFDRKTVTVGLPEPAHGISEQRAADFGSQPYESVKSTLELEGVEYNISVPGVFEKGRNVTTDTAVTAVSFPVTVLHRYGNASLNRLNLRVWSR